jgi:hypothetical protein
MHKTNDYAKLVIAAIAGALALPGLCIILSLSRIPGISRLLLSILAGRTLLEFVLIIGSVGGLFALLLRIICPKTDKLLAASGGGGALVVVCALYIDSGIQRISSPNAMKLFDCTNSVFNFPLTVPRGHDFVLDIQIPQIESQKGNSNDLYRFSGSIRIVSNNLEVANQSINSNEPLHAGDRHVLAGGLQNTNTLALSKILKPHETYDLTIQLDPNPPPGSSIWLFWKVSGMDK